MKFLSQSKIVPTLSNNLYCQLQNNSQNLQSMLAEIIDNSLGAMVGNECNVSIEIRGVWQKGKLIKNKDNKIIITDDSSGIGENILADALGLAALAGTKPNSLNEHGMGMKVALVSIGTSTNPETKDIEDFEIYTKCQDNDILYINKLSINGLELFKYEDKTTFPNDHGTKIIIGNLDNRVYKPKGFYSQNLIWFLGHRYQLYLTNRYNKKLNLEIILTDLNGNIINTDNQPCRYYVSAITPVFKNNHCTNDTLPKGSGAQTKIWKADAIFGLAQTKLEILSYPDDDPIKARLRTEHPYYIEKDKIDIIKNNIVVKQVDLSWLKDIAEQSADRYVRGGKLLGQLILREGDFNTAFFKIDFNDSENMRELKTHVDEFLEKIKLVQEKYPTLEKELKDKIEERFKAMDIEYQREPTVRGAGLRMDFCRGEEIWEIKRDTAGADDAAQLIAYLLLDNKKQGVLVARDFSNDCRNTIEVAKTHNFQIKLIHLNKLI